MSTLTTEQKYNYLSTKYAETTVQCARLEAELSQAVAHLEVKLKDATTSSDFWYAECQALRKEIKEKDALLALAAHSEAKEPKPQAEEVS